MVLSLYAALLHNWVLPEHYREWWGYGMYFFVATAGQVFFSGTLLFWPRRSVLVTGIVANCAMLLLYAATRSFGIPFFGPAAGQIEPVGALDLLTASAELALVALLLHLFKAQVRAKVAPARNGTNAE